MKMNDVSSRINERLYEHKWYKRFTAITIVMSMLCAFFVPLDLVMPGFAATNYTFPAGQEYFDPIPDRETWNNSSWGTNLANGYLDEAQVKASASDSWVSPENFNVQGGDNTEVELYLKMNYSFADAGPVISDPFVCYQLPSNVKVSQSSYGVNAVVTDPNYSGTAGYYFISDTGLVVIHFTHDYIEYVRTHSNAMRGSVDFKCKVERKGERDGTQTVTIGDSTITIPFNKTNLSQTKSHAVGAVDGVPYIDWKITINNPNGYVDMEDFVLSDTMDGATYNISGATVAYYDSNNNPITLTSGSAVADGNNLKFTALNPSPAKIEVTYRQTNPPQNTEIKNKSSLTKSEENVPDSNEDSVTVNNTYDLRKSGSPDYSVDGSTNNQIYWTINVSNNAGVSLANTVITDTFDMTGCTVKYRDVNGAWQDVSTSDFTVNGTTLTFADNVTFSAAQIVYTSSVTLDENRKSENNVNYVSAETPGTNTPPKVENVPSNSVTYVDGLRLNKTIDQNLNYDTGLMKWKIKIVSNAYDQYGNVNNSSDYSKASLDGYIIEDSAFNGLTPDQVQDELRKKITYNAKSYGKSIVDSISFEKVSDTQYRVVVNEPTDGSEKPVLTELELFYFTTETVNASGDTSVSNTATVEKDGHTAEDTVSKTYSPRDEKKKTYTTADAYIEVMGNSDTTPRQQSWKVVLINDSGFAVNATVLSDELQVYDTSQWQALSNSGTHYISATEAGSFVVKSAATEANLTSDEASLVQTLTKDVDYQVIFKDSAGNTIDFTTASDAKAVSFEVQMLKPQVNHYMSIVYNSMADIQQVPSGSEYQFKNKIGDYNTTDGLKFKRKSITDVENIHLKVSKTWDDSHDKDKVRPSGAELTVQRTTTAPNENGVFPDSTVWEDVGTYTVAIGSDKYADTVSCEIKDTNGNVVEFPRWKVENDEQVFYYYQIVEPEIPDYVQTGHGNAINAETAADYSEYSLTNRVNIDKSFQKVAINASGNAITEMEFSDVPVETVNINGTDTLCYIFTWKYLLNFADNNISNGFYTYTDTLPTNSILITKYNVDGSVYALYKPYLYGEWNTGAIENITYDGEVHEAWGQTEFGYITINGQQMTLVTGNLKQWEYFIYSTAIPVETFQNQVRNGNRIITNTAYEGDNTSGTPKEASITVTGEIPPNMPYLDKQGQAGNAGELKYHFDFNPEGLQLSSGDEVELIDCLMLNSQTNSDLKYQLGAEGVKVYPYNSDGTRSNVPLSTSEYTVLVYYNTTDIPEDLADTGGTSLPAKLIITVPDRTHLYIEYSYKVSGYKETKWELNGSTQNITEYGDDLKYSNTVLFRTESAHGMDTSDETQLDVKESHAIVTVTTYPEIYKVDVNSVEIKNLDAKFKIARMNSNETWSFASGETVSTDTSGKTYRQLVFNTDSSYQEAANATKPPAAAYEFEISSSNSHNLKLTDDEPVLYKFVETIAPTDYKQPDWTNGDYTSNSEFVTYYTYNGTPADIPAGITVHPITAGSTVNISNVKNITVKAHKTFSGSEVPDSAEITYELRWNTSRSIETSKPMTDLIAGYANATKTATFTKTATADTGVVSWTDLPSGKGGNPVYYFVQETAYKIGDITYAYDSAKGGYYSGETQGPYQPTYIGNGTNADVSDIEVNNSPGVVIRKLWVDARGNTVEPPNDPEISGKTMVIQFSATAITADNNYITLNLTNPVLSPDNGYEYILPSTVKDTNGNTHQTSTLKRIELTELPTLAQKAAMDGKYLEPYTKGAITNGTGIINLVNTEISAPYTNFTVTKQWADGNDSHSGDSVTVRLVQSTSSTLTDTEIQARASSTQTLKDVDGSDVTMTATLDANGSWTYTWSKLPYQNSSKQVFYYYAVETALPDGYTAVYSRTDEVGVQGETIVNGQLGKINVTKNWAGMTGLSSENQALYKQEVVLELKKYENGSWQSFSPAKTVTLNSSGWSGQFTGLNKTDDSGNPILYRVFEKKIGDTVVGDWDTSTDIFSITYSDNNGNGVSVSESTPTVTVTNTLKTGGLEVEKKWHDEDSTNRKEVTVNVYRTIKRNIDGVDTIVMNSNLNAADTAAGISKNMSRKLSLSQVNAPNRRLTVTSINSVNATDSVSNSEVTKDSDGGFSIKITNFTYDSSTNKLSFEIPESVMDEIQLDTIISGEITKDKAIKFYIPSDLAEAQGISKINGKAWTNAADNQSGYEAQSSVSVSSPNNQWYMKVWGDGGAGSFEFDVVTDGSGSSSAIQRTASHAFTTNAGQNNVLIPNELQSQGIKKVTVEFDPSMTDPRNSDSINVWFNHVDEGGNWNGTGSSSHVNINGNTKIFNYSSSSFNTTPTYFGMGTNQNTKIKKVTIEFDDDSTFTITNSNYVSSPPIVDSPVANIVESRTFSNGSYESQRIPQDFDGKELAGLKVCFTEEISANTKSEIESNYVNPYFKVGDTSQENNWGDYQGNSPKGNGITKQGADVLWDINSGFTDSRNLAWKIEQKDKIKQIVVTYTDGSTYTLKNAEYQELEPETYELVNVTVPSGQPIATLTLSADSWKDSISGLPLRDPDGNEYVYFIKEVDVPGYKPVGYYLESGTSKTVNSTELAENSTKHFAIHNAEDSSSSTTLPEAGGSGASIYYITGALLMLLTAAGYTMFKRRRWLSE